MPTPSKETLARERGGQSGEWAARTDTPKRSVFGNYRANGAPLSEPARSEAKTARATSETGVPLQTAIDLAIARSFIHRYLAKAYEDPTPESWQWRCNPGTQENLQAAWDVAQRRTGVAPVSNFSELISINGDRRDACPTLYPTLTNPSSTPISPRSVTRRAVRVR